MIIKIPIKPISVNQAYYGRHIETSICRKFKKDCMFLLPNIKAEGEYYHLKIHFFIKTFARTDEDNLVKILQDCLVKKGIISDDSKIAAHDLRKYPADIDGVVIEIEKMDKPNKREYPNTSIFTNNRQCPKKDCCPECPHYGWQKNLLEGRHKCPAIIPEESVYLDIDSEKDKP